MNQLQAIARRIMSERGLLPEFSARALQQARAINGAAHDAGPQIRDLRERLWVSIDNDSSRDLDQLSVAEALPGGATRVFVAIADVDVLVQRGSAIDEHASANTTSVYTAAGNFPMLPERLSTDLTSLNEDQERLALVMEMDVSADGSVVRSEPYRAAVLNRAKLAYDSVAAWLEGHAPAPGRLHTPALAEQLRLQDRAAQSLRQLRRQHGSLDLQTPQAEAVFEGEQLADLRPAEPNRAKQLIEDFMLAANAATSRYLGQRRFPLLRRVLRSPERWDRIAALAAQYGGRLPPEPNATALARFLSARHEADPAGFADLSLSVVKLLGRGEYAFELPGAPQQGHFGLAVSDYTHATAPNRRFPDLVIQRLLKAALGNQSAPYSTEELSAIARHCNEQEQNAAKVERQVNKCAAATLLASRIGERFDAIVTGASASGTWVRISRPAVEGRLVSGFHGLDVGDRLRVELLSTEIEKGFIDFRRAEAA
jgi:VacB/RNase II family 3'-5' exoribonuclease